jgi:hypothetical protein
LETASIPIEPSMVVETMMNKNTVIGTIIAMISPLSLPLKNGGMCNY